MIAPKLVTEKDVPRLVKLLLKAFEDDPFYRWTFLDKSILPNYFDKTIRQAIQDDLAMTTNDCLGVSIWSPKQQQKKMDNLPIKLSSEKPSPLTLAMLQLENHRPQEAHLHLRILATDPMARRQGIGRLLAKTPPPSLQNQTLPIYLEATTPAGVAFYEKIGFSIVSQIEIPEGPSLWGMQGRKFPLL